MIRRGGRGREEEAKGMGRKGKRGERLKWGGNRPTENFWRGIAYATGVFLVLGLLTLRPVSTFISYL